MVDYAPDGFGRPQKVGSYASNVAYFPNGQVAGYDLGNGATVTIGQHERLFPDSVLVSGSILDKSYDYDLSGNVTGITDGLDSNYDRTMTYDGLNRLKTWDGGAISYDAIGNITAKQFGPHNLTYNYHATTQRLSGVTGTEYYTFSYDNYGNVTANGRDTFVYDHASNLVAVNGAGGETYEYDGNDRRVVIKKNGQTAWLAVYNQGGQLLHEKNPATGQDTSYYYLGGQLIARQDNCPDDDSDSDGITDCREARYGFDPLDATDGLADYDGDGLSNANEIGYGTSMVDTDTDSDGMPDAYEVARQQNPLSNDAGVDVDGDTLTNLEEYQAGTNPNNSDTDGDGVNDANDLQPLFNEAMASLWIPVNQLLLH